MKRNLRSFGDLPTLDLLMLQAELLQPRASFDALTLANDDGYQDHLATYSLAQLPTEIEAHQSLGESIKLKSDPLEKIRGKLKDYSSSKDLAA